MMKEISSLSNPRVKQWIQLQDKKGREKHNKYRVEGIHLVTEALQSNIEIECIVYSINEGIPAEIKPYQSKKNIEWIAVSIAILEKCTDTVTPQGIFAVIHKSDTALESILNQPDPLVIVLDAIQDPGNLGTIIRSADAFGASGVVIGKGSVDLLNPKTIRSTMGSLFHLPIIEGDLQTILEKVQKKSIEIISTGLKGKNHCYDQDFTRGIWIVIGNEAQGVSKYVSPYIRKEILIPMVGQAESLNAAMATTVLLYEASRQRFHYHL